MQEGRIYLTGVYPGGTTPARSPIPSAPRARILLSRPTQKGENYLFEIKDISDGGCALMTRSPNLKFLSHNAILKNAILAVAEYGEITVDLVIKNVVMVTLDDNEKSDSYYKISCQFKFRHLDNKKRIEKVLLDLIMEAKRKKRV